MANASLHDASQATGGEQGNPKANAMIAEIAHCGLGIKRRAAEVAEKVFVIALLVVTISKSLSMLVEPVMALFP